MDIRKKGREGVELTAGTFMTTSEMALKTKMIVEQTTRAVVGLISNSTGHKDMKCSGPRVVLL